ncbi:hypothetical protein DOY81_015581, partial [Sarcophaga bullata]
HRRKVMKILYEKEKKETLKELADKDNNKNVYIFIYAKQSLSDWVGMSYDSCNIDIPPGNEKSNVRAGLSNILG